MSTKQKFLLNQQFFEENVKESNKKNEFDNLGNTFFKGFNKLKRSFSNFFDNKENTKQSNSLNVRYI